ncbi:MAG: translesion error-prone DNA polymerase V autoproteolytic subunit [Rhodospirillales bacterium]|nr:translesion error-prone DNA polymerase V autoproteolytic subunit [Rhodospirillales bacterium]
MFYSRDLLIRRPAIHAADVSRRVSLRLLSSPVQAGFPSPAEDHVEGKLDLNEHLIRRPAATFIVRLEGESMIGAGLFPGDLLVVDRGAEPRPGRIVIAILNGELTVKRLQKESGNWILKAENPNFSAIPVTPDMECTLWGVVTSSIRQFGDD